ncbi:hypothetical protein B0H11DRAFT_1726079, partial [Mycena galericulata]
ASDGPRMPHPEVHMAFVKETSDRPSEARPWNYLMVDSLKEMREKFTRPYILFYPLISRDGHPFPINASIRAIQGQLFREETAWRGDIVVAKVEDGDKPFASLVDISAADFAILQNFLMKATPPLSFSHAM